MDEEYDVIVLGTGLTVSSQSGLICACTETKKRGGMRELPCGFKWAASGRWPVIFLCSWLKVKRLPASQ